MAVESGKLDHLRGYDWAAKRAILLAARCASQRYWRLWEKPMSRGGVKRAPFRLHAALQVRVLQSRLGYKVNRWSAGQCFQSFAQAKIGVGVVARRQWLKVDQQIEVATGRVEVVASRRRTEQS
jgi:hypothetical protein